MMSDVEAELENGVAVITISRPEKRNAFNQSIRESLSRLLAENLDNRDCRGIILTGAGQHFSAGGDVAALARMSQEDLTRLFDAAHRCITLIRTAGKPVLAAVEGSAAGGAVGLALACDAIVATRGSRFVFPFLNLGLVPDWGCVHLLRKKVGAGSARRLLLRPSEVCGQTAMELGMVDQLVESGEALDRARDLLNQYLTLPLPAWAHTKAMLNSEGLTLGAALAQEREYQNVCFGSSEFRERLGAYLNKRPSAATPEKHRRLNKEY